MQYRVVCPKLFKVKFYRTNYFVHEIIVIVESVDSISKDGTDTPMSIYTNTQISQKRLLCEISKCQNQNLQQIIY